MTITEQNPDFSRTPHDQLHAEYGVQAEQEIERRFQLSMERGSIREIGAHVFKFKAGDVKPKQQQAIEDSRTEMIEATKALVGHGGGSVKIAVAKDGKHESRVELDGPEIEIARHITDTRKYGYDKDALKVTTQGTETIRTIDDSEDGTPQVRTTRRVGKNDGDNIYTTVSQNPSYVAKVQSHIAAGLRADKDQDQL